MNKIPFSTLRAFEAAARHQSFSRAAAELNVTNSAISHQLKRLEEALETRLFAKSGRGVMLTDAGETFVRAVRDSLGNISATAAILREMGSPGGKLVIACPPMFASKWLAKNLLAFTEAHPKVECHIRLFDSSRFVFEKDYDLAIGFGQETDFAGRWHALLRKVTLTPAISSRLYAHSGQILHSPADLTRTTLLHRDDGPEWYRWFASAGIAYPQEGQRHLYCSDMSVAIDLAIEGVGVALVSEVLSLGSIHQGTLVRPFSQSIRAEGAWYAVCDRHQLERGSVRAFLRWLFDRFGTDLELEPTANDAPGSR